MEKIIHFVSIGTIHPSLRPKNEYKSFKKYSFHILIIIQDTI